MHKYLVLSATFLLASCGFTKWLGENPDKNRELASLSVAAMTQEESVSFAEEIDSKLNSLHIYYMLGQHNMALFDAQIEETSIEDMYQSEPYLKLLAVRTQAEEIEHELLDAYTELGENKSKKSKEKMFLLQMRIMQFAAGSSHQKNSMENLGYQLGFSMGGEKTKLGAMVKPTSVQKELKELQNLPEFSIYEKNIEHQAFMMKTNVEAAEKRFFPSQTKAGAITGNEFPAKVWSLTFDDGPNTTSSATILKHLKDKNIKATFFQLTSMAKANPTMAKQLRDAGMEIASHSYSHKQLTKVGAQTLEHEITEAIKDLAKLHGTDIRFFRLPYGAGVSTASIRQKIAQNNTIHVFWNIDTLDWMSQTPDKIVTRTLSLMKKTKSDAGVLLFHDIHVRTSQAIPQILDYLKKDQRRVCVLADIVDQMNEGAQTVCPKE